MAGYVESVIGKGESVLYRAHLSMLSFWISFTMGGVFLFTGLVTAGLAVSSKDVPIGLSLVYLLVGGLILLRPLLAQWTTELVMTNRRVIAKFGVVKRNTVELNLSKIESIRVEQSLIGRLLNYGDVLLVGTGGSKEPIPRIARPLEFRRRYDEILVRNEAQAA